MKYLIPGMEYLIHDNYREVRESGDIITTVLPRRLTENSNITDLYSLFFQSNKTDFGAGLNGGSHALFNAYNTGAVVEGDVLQITTSVGTQRYMYAGPGGNSEEQRFLPTPPTKKNMGVNILSEIIRWEKVDHILPCEWNAMITDLQ